MKHVRILSLCLAVVFAMGATTLVVSPALASGCDHECKELKEKEKQEAKEKKEREKQEAKEAKEKEQREAKEKKEREKLNREEEKTHPWQKYFGVCPTTASGVNGCVYAETGSESFFQAGKLTVSLARPLILQGGLIHEEEPFVKYMSPALNGQTIVSAAEPTESLTEAIDPEQLSEKEKQRYERYLASGGSTKVTATPELASPASAIEFDPESILQEWNESENRPAYVLPVMIHLSNKFLGADCYVGSTVSPMDVSLYAGETSPPPPNAPIHGTLQSQTTHGGGSVYEIQSKVVGNSYASPGVQGCGVYNGANAALDSGLALPSPAGSNTSELTGFVLVANSELVEEGLRGAIPFLP